MRLSSRKIYFVYSFFRKKLDSELLGALGFLDDLCIAMNFIVYESSLMIVILLINEHPFACLILQGAFIFLMIFKFKLEIVSQEPFVLAVLLPHFSKIKNKLNFEAIN